MKRWAFLTLVLLITPQAPAQFAPSRPPPLPDSTEMKSRDFLRMQGDAAMVPAAQITFRHTVEDQLCAVLGIKRGPQAINKNFFLFERLTIRSGESDSEKLEFKFPKKPREKTEAFYLWESCVASEALRAEEDDDLIVVRVRRPHYKPSKLWIGYPDSGISFVMNISAASNGDLISQNLAYREGEGTDSEGTEFGGG